MEETPSEVDLNSDCSEHVKTPKKRRKIWARTRRSAKPTTKLNVDVNIETEVESRSKRSSRHNPAFVALKDLCVICQKEKTSPGKRRRREPLCQMQQPWAEASGGGPSSSA